MSMSTHSSQEISRLIKSAGLRHIAIIMDGNRRWAEEHHQPSLMGHRQGVKSLKAIITHAGNIGLEALTVYAFSTENWRRTSQEVGYLMDLFAEALLAELEGMAQNNVRLKIIGDLAALKPSLRQLIQEAEARLSGNSGLKFQVAMNYGSRSEIVSAVKAIVQEVQNGELSIDAINESAIENRLYTANTPELDLLIRTGGESRLSNYLLWQAAYAEFYVTPSLWPEFSPERLDEAILDFANRKRRYGK
ncbi:MAG: polyprenyl diphosphate synthase [Vampirovibrionales bacterium]|nr:polyprenyl diphosphate synthase [Vampirovibrionales bacterium]